MLRLNAECGDLHSACILGDISLVNAIINKNMYPGNGKAAHKPRMRKDTFDKVLVLGNKDIILALINMGIKVNQVQFCTIISIFGKSEVVNILIRKGNHLSIRSMYKLLAIEYDINKLQYVTNYVTINMDLFWAFYTNDIEAIKNLLNNRIINHISNIDIYTLMVIVFGCTESAIIKPNKYTLNNLLLTGYGTYLRKAIDAGAQAAEDTLTLACYTNCFYDIRDILRAGGKPDEYTLTVACAVGNEHVVNMLIDAGAKPNEDTVMWAIYSHISLTEAMFCTKIVT